ncbi:MAG: biopolymer transporter ExbD [Isosphaeraceae bacterium]
MLLQQQAQGERDEHIDMTPMVDVVFQLMTFMLFSMQLTTGQVVNVPPARHGTSIPEDGAIFITIMKPEGPNDDPLVLRGNGGGTKKGMNKTAAGLEEAEALKTDQEIENYISEGVGKGLRKVIIQADGDVPHGQVLRLASAITKVEGITLHIGVREPD